MKGDSGIILRIEEIGIDGYGIQIDPSLADPSYRDIFGRQVTLSLINWRDRGLRIDAQLVPGVIAEYCAAPYHDRDAADREYDKLRDAVKSKKHRIFSNNGNMKIEIVE